MELSVCCTFLFSLLIRRSSGSNVPTEILSYNHNSNILECLNTLISVTDWKVDHFLLISRDMDNVENDLLRQHSNFGWKLYSTGNHNLTEFFNVIIFAKDFHELNETLSAINIKKIDSRAKFVISIATNLTSLNEIKKASKGISSVMWNLDKTRIVYLVPSNQGILAMTYFPFVKNCQVDELEVLDIWRGKEFEKRNELFPEKMLDIHGCVQNHIGPLNDKLGFQLNVNITETGEEILGGIGGRLITIVAKKMNMPLQFTEENIWEIFVNQIVRGESLLAVTGYIPVTGIAEIFDMDTTYLEERFTFCYVTGDSEVSWKNMVYPLSKETWPCIGCTFLLFFGFIVLANKCDRWVVRSEKLKIFDSFGIFLGSSRLLPRSDYGRCLMGMWIVYSFLINAFYNSGSVCLLTIPREPRVINTLEELLAAGIDFGGRPRQREFYNDPSDPVMMKIYDDFKIWPHEEISRIVLSGEGTSNFLSSTVYEYNRYNVDYENYQLRMLQENAFIFHVPILMRKGSPFKFGVHRYAVQVIESGFIEHWKSWYTSTSKRNSTETVTGLSTRHIQGILYLYIAGIISSSLAFLLELIFRG